MATAFGQLVYPNIIVQYDSAFTYKNLQIIPIKFRINFGSEYNFANKAISLEQAIKQGKIQVKEFYYLGDADVNMLQIKNKTNEYIFIESGEMLKGGKQDRMIAESKIIPPKADQEFVKVLCIEKGRWDKKAKKFSYAGNADAWLKKMIDTTNQQQVVWKEIENRLQLQPNTISTLPYLETLNNNINDTAYTHFFTNKIAQSDSLFAGFIAITDTTIISAEVFSQTQFTLTNFKSMLQGWVQAATIKGNVPNMPYKNIKLFTDAVFTNEEMQKKYLQKHGKSFEYQGKVFHIIANGH